jgi:hypothetical protein
LAPSAKACFPAADFVADAAARGRLAAALNRFDAALCDGEAAGFFAAFLRAFLAAFLAAFLGACRPVVPALLLPVVADFAPAGRPDAGLEDFLRDFLDIRLPFVAFGGSIIGVLRSCPANQFRVGGWASLTASGYGYKDIDAAPVHSSVKCQLPDDE